MRNWIVTVGSLVFVVNLAVAETANVSNPAEQRFADPDCVESPDFQRHVLPLMSRLGCNGRACHGSFQGQGGFRLSLFGYDFAMDHESLAQGDEPRVDVEIPEASRILLKGSLESPHKGGKRFEIDSWQYRVLLNWIRDGAEGAPRPARLERLEVTPTEILFERTGDKVPLKVIAHWENGESEDVTCLTRFRTNDESIAQISEEGVVTGEGRGDTHVVAFYDNGIVPVPVIIPLSGSEPYPEVPTPTRIDGLVVEKLRKVGIVPSELCDDAEFLRRVSLDMTGTLPSAKEVEKFLADADPDKRTRKVEELLERPEYAAWWATKFCDITGNNPQYLDQPFRNQQAEQWYAWVRHRIEENTPYDEMVAGILLATSRLPGQDYEQYVEEMSGYLRGDDGASRFAERESMPHYWTRRNVRKPEEKALGVSHAFLGVRLQCAECHKHPFDQWTQEDFKKFTAFFTPVSYGLARDARPTFNKMQQDLGLTGKRNNEIQRALPDLLRKGNDVPFREVFAGVPGNARRPKDQPKKKRENGGDRVITPKVLGGEEVAETGTDPRDELMEWMRSADNPYFARAYVNRVWAAYFGTGIIDPPDDQNLANPPSNQPLLDYLVREFVDRGFDMKWLHREIATSRTYQLSWRPNETNLHDVRNFSRAQVRRLPAEVAYDALVRATAANPESTPLERRAIAGLPRRNDFALEVFGRPRRETTCDCERSNEPNLVQTLFLRNDSDALKMIDRKGSWIEQLAGGSPANAKTAAKPVDQRKEAAAGDKKSPRPAAERKKGKNKPAAGLAKGSPAADPQSAPDLEMMRRRAERFRDNGNTERAEKIEAMIRQLEKPTEKVARQSDNGKPAKLDGKATREMIRQAYLRTLSRPPSTEELARAHKHVRESSDGVAGMRDVLWALLNTKEFIVNH